jgi:GT2 family glycosyltransferase
MTYKPPAISWGPSPDVSVVVVTHQSAADIEPCLSSVREHPPTVGHEVIVVDNASTDGTVELVEEKFPEVTLVRGARRRGFATNCNNGVRLARGRVLVLLNPDTRVMPGAIDGLVAFLDAHPAVAVVGPRLVYPDGSPQPSARRFPTARATVIRRSPLRWALPDTETERHHLMLDEAESMDCARPVDWVLGAAMATRRELYRSLGGMDEGYRLYCEDIDLCWRTWQAGFGVAYLPIAVVEHQLSELTRRRFLTRATVWHVRGMARFTRHHGLRPSAAAPGSTLGLPSDVAAHDAPVTLP